MSEGCRFRVEIGEDELHLRIGAAMTAVTVSPDDPPDWMRIHPQLMRMPDGRLILTVSRDRDIIDSEHIVYESLDTGQSWRETSNWPGGNARGEHLTTQAAVLPNGEVLVLYTRGLFPTPEQGVYNLPSWRSTDGGETWSGVEAARVELPIGTAVDIYDPPDSYLAARPNLADWRKAAPPPALERLRARFGPERVMTVTTDVCVLDEHRLLLFAYLTPEPGGKHITVCLASDDAGRTWRHRATPGAWEDRLATENFLRHPANGLCEPSVARLPKGELLLVMRLGSRHPLYATHSSDDAHTWTPPRPLSVWGILPTVLHIEGDLLALASGRPHITFSLSFDQGYRWPLTHRFLEDGKPEDPSTRNNTMIAVAPRRLLYMYDMGGYHALPEAFQGERRIVGHFIDID